jgi:hypothetical protein
MNINPILAANVRDINGNSIGTQGSAGPCPGGGPKTAGPPSVMFSQVSVSPDSIAPGGTATVTMTLLDTDGNFMNTSGGLGTITNDFGAQNGPTPFSAADNGDGTYTFTVTDAGAFSGYGFISVYLGGQLLQASGQVYVGP